jgi:hypothetical protein
MTNHPDAQLGIAMLTARLAGDQDAFAAITKDMPQGYAIALLMRTAEMLLSMLADATGQTKDEALKTAAAALAAES